MGLKRIESIYKFFRHDTNSSMWEANQALIDDMTR